ncbi:ATP-binding protein [Microvirga soli]|uniref:ATP-binding protein n=1 Tax=Microvirga soli TaxID=1854496 RepID=UPI001FEBD5CE|nr:ATP-binding protein [Microvirga soli]
MMPILRAIAFPWFIYDLSGNLIDFGKGSLFDLPGPAKDSRELDFYSSLRREGWHKCPLGYAVFVRELSAGSSSIGAAGRLILPGLKVAGISTASGKSDGLTIRSEQKHVERHVNDVLMAQRDTVDRFDEISRQNIHEIRGINSGLYHAAIELQGAIDKREDSHWREVELAGNIVAMSQILSARMDFINYYFDESLSEQDVGEVHAFRKFDKMCRSFRSKASRNKNLITLNGNSYNSTLGPRNLLDLAAYLLLDNAVKYSPQGESILVNVNDVGPNIKATITNTGPAIEKEELDKVFQQDFRGHMARRSGIGGSGIGLFLLKRLVEDGFGGKIELSVGASKGEINGIHQSEVTFTVLLPGA